MDMLPALHMSGVLVGIIAKHHGACLIAGSRQAWDSRALPHQRQHQQARRHLRQQQQQMLLLLPLPLLGRLMVMLWMLTHLLTWQRQQEQQQLQ